MKNQQYYILFCENPLCVGKVDDDYQDQFVAAQENGFQTLLFNYETLTSTNNPMSAIKSIKPNNILTNVIYRGWMLRPKQYTMLYDSLLSKNYQLINTAVEYQNCHYLPNSLKYIVTKTPITVFEKLDGENSIEMLINKAKIFGQKPVIIKDYVKSEKHHWETACFIADATNTNTLRESIKRLIELRNKYLNEGIVIREFVELNKLTIHSKSQMPLTEEYRLFFFQNKLIGIYDYWEEGEYIFSKPDTTIFETIAQDIESNFFSMDIARQQNGEFIIIELGDGQVTGLPDKTDRNEFYKKLRHYC